MTLSDDELLDFDSSNYADYSEVEARRSLAELGDVFRAQLVAARAIEGWRERLLDHDRKHPSEFFTEDYSKGWAAALAEVVAHLRQGDFLPGAGWHDETIRARRLPATPPVSDDRERVLATVTLTASGEDEPYGQHNAMQALTTILGAFVSERSISSYEIDYAPAQSS